MRIGLSISGGGIRGLIAAEIGYHIASEVGRPLADCVDLLYGTSTGGIIALGSAASPAMTMHDMVQLYHEHGKEIFGKKSWLGFRGILGMQYKRKPLNKLLTGIFHEETLASCTIPTAVTSYNLQRTQPTFMKSWRESDQDIRIVDAALATSAAWPTYFKPHIVHNEALIDGGFVGNNPAAFCYADLTHIHPGEDAYAIISIGTGEAIKRQSQKQAMKSGLLKQGGHLVDVFFDGSADAMNYVLRQIPRVRLYRLQLRLKEASHAMDDASPKNLKNLSRDAQRFIEESMADPDSELVQAISLLKSR